MLLRNHRFFKPNQNIFSDSLCNFLWGFKNSWFRPPANSKISAHKCCIYWMNEWKIAEIPLSGSQLWSKEIWRTSGRKQKINLVFPWKMFEDYVIDIFNNDFSKITMVKFLVYCLNEYYFWRASQSIVPSFTGKITLDLSHLNK
jgi:hypothetical protein